MLCLFKRCEPLLAGFIPLPVVLRELLQSHEVPLLHEQPDRSFPLNWVQLVPVRYPGESLGSVRADLP
jgi:hypothetical protein